MVFSHSISSRSVSIFGFIAHLVLVIKSWFYFLTFFSFCFFFLIFGFLAKAGVSSSSRYSNVTWQDYYFP